MSFSVSPITEERAPAACGAQAEALAEKLRSVEAFSQTGSTRMRPEDESRSLDQARDDVSDNPFECY